MNRVEDFHNLIFSLLSTVTTLCLPCESGVVCEGNASSSTAALNDGAVASQAFALRTVSGSDGACLSANTAWRSVLGTTTRLSRRCTIVIPITTIAATATMPAQWESGRRDAQTTLTGGIGSGAIGWNRFK